MARVAPVVQYDCKTMGDSEALETQARNAGRSTSHITIRRQFTIFHRKTRHGPTHHPLGDTIGFVGDGDSGRDSLGQVELVEKPNPDNPEFQIPSAGTGDSMVARLAEGTPCIGFYRPSDADCLRWREVRLLQEARC